MNGRTSRLDTFLVRFGELKAAAGNDPTVLCTFDQTTPEIRAAADLMHDYLVGSEVEREMFHGADKLIAHAPEGIERAWNEFKQFWEPGINYLAMCEIDPDWPRDYNEHLRLYAGSGIIPDGKGDLFLPGFHDGLSAPQAAMLTTDKRPAVISTIIRQRKPLAKSRSEKRPTLNVQSARNSLSQWPTRATVGANRRK